MNMKNTLLCVVITSLLSGCAANSAQLAANAYSANQVNQKQEAKTVQIISVLPAKVFVDNTANKETAKAFGTLLGIAAGATIGNSVSNNKGADIVGGVAGGVAGNLAGNVVSDKTEVDGVTLAYQENGKVFTSTQVGRDCEFKPGIALMVNTGKGDETRIQPNASCPMKK